MIHLNNEQQRAAMHFGGPMLVLAGPGSGKTAVITERIHYLLDKQVNADSILVLTFSNKAAREMQRRFIAAYGNSSVHFGTFHSVFFHELSRYRKYGKENIVTSEQSINIIKDVALKLNMENIDRKWCIDTLGSISVFKNTGNLPEYLLDDESKLFPLIFDEYVKRLKNAGLIDFDDMISDCLLMYINNPIALEKIRERYCYIMIDEFQDCNRDQYELIKLVAGPASNVFAVGDDDQCIYGFRGSDAGIVNRFLLDYQDCGYVELIRNYRCSKVIIDNAYSLIGHNKNRKDKTKQLPSLLRDDGEICVIKTEDAYSEAEAVYEIILKLQNDGVKLNEISILFRTETVSDYLQEYLGNKHIGIGFNTKNSIYDKDYFKDIMAYLKISQNRYDPGDYLRILNKPDRGLVRECINPENVSRDSMLLYYRDDIKMLKKLVELFAEIDFISSLTTYAAINYIWKKILGNIKPIPDELMNLAKKYETINELILSDKNKKYDKKMKEDALVLQTIHASKGLEYDTVIIIGLQEGIMPHNKARNPDSLEEERRLMYVAMTRAKNRLYLIARGKENHGKKYSRFISELNLDYKSMEVYTPSSRNSSKASSTASYSSSSSI